MNQPYAIEHRKPIWIALSNFYLDTGLQETDLQQIAGVILASPYSWEEIRKIDKYEVFPVLHVNLLSVAGEWAGFNEDWLVEIIDRRQQQRNRLKNIGLQINYAMYGSLCRDHWEKLEKIYLERSASL